MIIQDKLCLSPVIFYFTNIVSYLVGLCLNQIFDEPDQNAVILRFWKALTNDVILSLRVKDQKPLSLEGHVQ